MTLIQAKQPPAHHKKRTGEHQKRSKHFRDTYWPYLPLILIAVLGLAFNSLWQASGTVLGDHTDITVDALAQETNELRAANHQATMTVNDRLNAAAQAKANDMVKRCYWSHDTPDNKTPWTFIQNAGYSFVGAGENLAYGFTTAQDVTTGWMNSTEHRSNILNNSYSQVGFGIVYAPQYMDHGATTLVVAYYAQPTSTSVTAVQSSYDVSNSTRSVARVQLLTNGKAAWSLAALTTLSGILLLIVLTRHGKSWHKTLVKSEAFILHHPLLDAMFVVIATTAIVLSQTAGTIL